MRAFLLDRIRLVNELISGGPKVDYADLVLILTAVLSACAANRWPGRGFDRNRFVELLVRHSAPNSHCDYICVPSLLNDHLISEAETPWGQPGEFTRIFRDDEIDLPYPEAQIRFSHISPLKLKQHSYAALIYSWLRCPYAHEYSTSGSTTHVPASHESARISYIGRLFPDSSIVRIASFHVDYLLTLTTHHAEQVEIGSEAKPPNWWLQIA